MGASVAVELPPGRAPVAVVLELMTGRSNYRLDPDEFEDGDLRSVARRSDETIYEFWERQRERAWSKGPHPCTAGIGSTAECYLEGHPHHHCRCGLPITLVQWECSTCTAERTR